MNEIEMNLYNVEEVLDNCTVVIWANSITGEKSWGWYDNANPPVKMEKEEE